VGRGKEGSLLEKKGSAHRGGSKGKGAAAAEKAPFDEHSPFASMSMLAPPFAMPDPNKENGVDFGYEWRPLPAFICLLLTLVLSLSATHSKSDSYPPPPADGSFAFPDLPPVPPLNSPFMPTPPMREAGDEPSGWDPLEAASHVPAAEEAAHW
jgi:hypothetical protein